MKRKKEKDEAMDKPAGDNSVCALGFTSLQLSDVANCWIKSLPQIQKQLRTTMVAAASYMYGKN
jgi:hypothetical protein